VNAVCVLSIPLACPELGGPVTRKKCPTLPTELLLCDLWESLRSSRCSCSTCRKMPCFYRTVIFTTTYIKIWHGNLFYIPSSVQPRIRCSVDLFYYCKLLPAVIMKCSNVWDNGLISQNIELLIVLLSSHLFLGRPSNLSLFSYRNQNFVSISHNMRAAYSSNLIFLYWITTILFC
jgi:hypothetical protein